MCVREERHFVTWPLCGVFVTLTIIMGEQRERERFACVRICWRTFRRGECCVLPACLPDSLWRFRSISHVVANARRFFFLYFSLFFFCTGYMVNGYSSRVPTSTFSRAAVYILNYYILLIVCYC